MKRVWWALPTTLLVCTGWLWSADAADLRLKKKTKPGSLRATASPFQDEAEAPRAARSAARVAAAEFGDELSDNLPSDTALPGRRGLTPLDQEPFDQPQRGLPVSHDGDQDSIVDRLLAEEGLIESKSKIQTVSAEIPEEPARPTSPGRYLRQKFKPRPKPTISADAPDAPEGIVGLNPNAEQPIAGEAPRAAGRVARTGSATVGASPNSEVRIPVHEEVPAPGVDDDAAPFVGAAVEDDGSLVDALLPPPPPANIRKPAKSVPPQVRRASATVAPAKVHVPVRPAPQAAPVPFEDEVPVAVAPPPPRSHSAARKVTTAAVQPAARASARRVQPVAHRTPNLPTLDEGELPALQPGTAVALNDSEGTAPPPPPNRVRPVKRTVPRRVQQTSISSTSAPTHVKLVPATVQSPQNHQTPSINLRWVTNGEVNVGQTCKCGLVVKNISSIDAHNILVEAAFPKSVRIVSAKPEPRLVEDNLIWKFSDFPAGEERTIEITMIPFKRGELATSASVRFTGTASTVMKVEEADLAVTIKGQQEASIGETVTHVVSVSNPGSGVAPDVTVHAVIPKGLEHPRGKRIEMTIGSLGAGETRDVRLALAAVAGGDHQVHVEARSGQHLVRRADSVVHVTAPKVNVAVQGPTLRYVGRQAQYVVQVSNVGTLATDNVRVQMQLANGFEFVKADHGGRHDWNSRTVTWFLNRLEANQRGEFHVTLSARQAGTHQHTVSVTDEVGSTSAAAVETRVETSSAIVMEVVDLDDPVEVGSQTAYEIRIRNEGTKAAQDVALSFEIPPGVELVDTQGPSAARRGKGGIAFKPLPSLSPKQRVSYRVIITGREAGNLRFRAKLTSNASTEPLVVEEQTKFYAD